MGTPTTDAWREAWEARTEWPLLAVAVLFLAGYAWPILDPTLDDGRWRAACALTTLVAWILFAIDYVARLALARQRWRFLRRNVLDLAVIVLPLLRPLRVLRLVALVRIFNRQTSGALRGRIAVYVTGTSALMIFCAALAILDAERAGADPNIETFPDAVWWAATTVTTVGYGDRYPTTPEGRLVAAGLMIAGIALLGVVTATLAQWFVEQVRQSDDPNKAEIAKLTEEVALLRQQLELHGPAGSH